MELLSLGGSDDNSNCQNGSNSTQAETGFVIGLSSSEPAERADPGDACWSVIRELVSLCDFLSCCNQ